MDHGRDDGLLAREFWDLYLVGGLALLTAGITFVSATAGTLPRLALAVFFVLFVPGYALVAALFPDADSLDGIERTAFSFGLSVALTGLLTLAVNFTPWGVRLVPVTLTLTGFTAVCLAIAGIRRRRYRRLSQAETTSASEDEVPTPFVVPFDRIPELISDIATSLSWQDSESRLETVLTIALVLSILFAAGTVAWTLSTPRPGERFTEFALFTEDDGEYVAGEYPTELTTTEPASVVMDISNHEFRSEAYTVVIRLRDPQTNRTERIKTFRDIQIAHNSSWMQSVSVTPPFTGQDLLLEFLLYRGPSTDGGPYRRTYLRVNVSESPERKRK